MSESEKTSEERWPDKTRLPGYGKAHRPGEVIPVNVSITDMVNRPPHYNHGKIEPIDVIEDWKLGFCDGNAVKYIARHQHKGTPLQDLKKARWYLDRAIKKLEEESTNGQG